MSNILEMYVIYKDLNGYWVGQLDVEGGSITLKSRADAHTLAEARAMIPRDLYRMPRFDADAPDVVETWF